MSKGFPIPLNAVRAIEIVARRGALAPAAEELGVTVGAVSQHLRRAEERLGMELFERTGHGLVPSAALRAALPQLSAGFAALQDGLAQLSGSDEAILNLTVGSVFASRWLIWRLNKFTTLHPDIEVRLTVTGAMLDLQRPDLDCGIRFGAGNWPGIVATPIGGARFQPVCAPPVARALHRPQDLFAVPVIRDQTTMLSWDGWLQAVGLDAERPLHGPTYSDPSLAFDAAISEQGVLMAVDMMSADAVSDGRLVRPFDHPVSGPNQYWLATARGRRETSKLRRFRDWLQAETPASAQGYVHQSRR